MKDYSFSQSCVVVQLAGKFYKVRFESTDLLKKTIKLQLLPPSSTEVIDSKTLRYTGKRYAFFSIIFQKIMTFSNNNSYISI